MRENPVILISSCVRDRRNGFQQAIRDTWGKSPAIPYRFFLGDVEAEEGDEVSLPCPDNYFSLPQKTKLSLEWALENDYSHAFRCFTDTFIDTIRLRASAYAEGDYIGNPFQHGTKGFFMHGGPGYWLSRRAAEIVVGSELSMSEQLEDQWVGRCLIDTEVTVKVDYRYSMGRSYCYYQLPVLPDNEVISEHLSKNRDKYEKWQMYKSFYASFK
jgi:hypothetical protein